MGGVALTLLAGVLNGSWNMSVKHRSPRILRIIGDVEQGGWDHRLAWMVMMIHATWINLLLSLLLIPPSTIGAVISSSKGSDVGLVVFFSFLWGLGTYGFGLAVQIAGIGMGTTLTMGVIVVIGTFLPLVLDVKGKLATLSGGKNKQLERLNTFHFFNFNFAQVDPPANSSSALLTSLARSLGRSRRDDSRRLVYLQPQVRRDVAMRSASTSCACSKSVAPTVVVLSPRPCWWCPTLAILITAREKHFLSVPSSSLFGVN